MKSRLIAILTVVAVMLAIIAIGIRYSRFVYQTIYTESTAHLTEIYYQVNQSLNNMVERKWGAMHMWVPYIQDATDAKKIDDYISHANEEVGFTDFYFISREGNYRTINGRTGYLNMKENLPDLIFRDRDVVVTSVVPGEPQITVFAVPLEAGTYKGFDYEAIAISFNNSDLIKSLETSAFDGQSSCYIVHSDGRVIVDNSASEDKHLTFFNFFAMMRDWSDLSEDEISSLHRDFSEGRSGSTAFQIDKTYYYLIYESADFEDWTVLGMIPASVVNSSMNNLQTYTLILVLGTTAVLGVILIVFIIRHNRLKLKRKDEEILYRDELFSNLSVHVDDVFMMIDADSFTVDYISPNIERLLGISEEEVRADILMITHLAKDDSTVQILDQISVIPPGQQGDWNREYIHKKTGEVRWFHIIALCSKIRDKKKYIIVMSDRTCHKKKNQDLEEAVSAAQSANRAKSTFLSNMSHDIRTPMNAIIGFATLAESNAEDPEKARNYLGKILSSSKYLLSLINDVLDMSRIESGKISIEETEADLSDMFHDIRAIICGQVYSKNLNLIMDSSGVTDEKVFCDKTRLNQVLLNLLSNAIKFTPSGGTVSVLLAQLHGASDGRGLYEIRVKDTGIGMGSDFASHIFESFERESTSTVSNIQGTGLGMAIAKNIIDMMGGTIDFHTEKDKGTEFVVRLSLRLRNAKEPFEKIDELKGRRALVVDENSDTCESLSEMLTRAGMRPEYVLTGEEAIARAEQSANKSDEFSTYIVSHSLTDMDSLEVVRQIRSLVGSAPIVIMAAYERAYVETEAIEAGVSSLCEKPIFMSDLRKSLLIALGKRSSKYEGLSDTGKEFNIFKGKHLLLVEDNELNREIVVEVLREYGFRIDTAKNGEEALKKVADSINEQYDAVLMDVQMPVMNGYETTQAIRSLPEPKLAEVPIIATTANAFEEDRKAAKACGMNGFISKPINKKEIEKALRKILS